MDTKKYIPDVSAFFEGERKLTVDDIFKLPSIEQETVSFAKNDIYLGRTQNLYKNNKNVKRKCRRRGKFKRTYP